MSRSTALLICLTAGTLSLAPTVASAEVQSEMAAFVVTVDAQGVEQFRPATVVNPGELIEYRLTHTNKTAGGIGSLAIVGPVPEKTGFVSASQQSSASAYFEVRADLDPNQPGDEWSPLPAMRLVQQPDGNYIYEEAGPELFTAIRWTLNGLLDRQQSVQNSYRIRVDYDLLP